MKLIQLYEQILNEVEFKEIETGIGVSINAIKDNVVVGKIMLEFIPDAYEEFEDFITSGDISEETFKKIFPDNSFCEIKYLNVIDGQKGKGYAKQLMIKGIEYSKKHGENVFYLNASPMGMTGLNINNLVDFYKSFGFKTIVGSNDNSEMYAHL